MKPLQKISIINIIFLSIVIFVSCLGFWNIYFGPDADPTFYQNLHVITTYTWLFLLLAQSIFIRNANPSLHIKIGKSILLVGPLLIATLILLSVHSASRSAAKGEADMLVIQNIFPAMEVGILILFGFLYRKNRILHGQLLMSTTLFFFGIALFFTLISFHPQYKIEGPETFYRFEEAGITATYISLGVGLILFLIQWRSGWPWLLVSVFFLINGFINYSITEANQTKALTAFIGSINEYVSFFGVFLIFLVVLFISLNIKVTPKSMK